MVVSAHYKTDCDRYVMLHSIQTTRPSSPTLRVGCQCRALSRTDDATTAGKLVSGVAVTVVQFHLEVLVSRLSCEDSSDRETHRQRLNAERPQRSELTRSR